MQESTLVLIKPDAYRRGLTGTILARFERAGLSIEKIRVSRAEDEMASAHYPTDETWLAAVGGKTVEDYRSIGLSVSDVMGTSEPLEIGQDIRARLVNFLMSGPLVVVLLRGNRAVESVRKLVGATLPVASGPGTIRGDFSTDSTDLASLEGRPVMNLVHASGDVDEAAREIALWFPES